MRIIGAESPYNISQTVTQVWTLVIAQLKWCELFLGVVVACSEIDITTNTSIRA